MGEALTQAQRVAAERDALTALLAGGVDLDRVAVRGSGFGGWLAALAVLRRPELFTCAVARTPISDDYLERLTAAVLNALRGA